MLLLQLLSADGELGEVVENLAGLKIALVRRYRTIYSVRRTSGWGLPCSCALIDQGRMGLPYFWRISFVIMEYKSSESINKPSMSKRHARMRGRLSTESIHVQVRP